MPEMKFEPKHPKPKMITQRAGPVNVSMGRETDPSSIEVKEIQKPQPLQSVRFEVSQTVDADLQPDNEMPLRSDLSSIISPAKQQNNLSSQDCILKEEFSHSETQANIQQLATLDEERHKQQEKQAQDLILLDDWRDEVQIGFEQVGSLTAIKLYQAGVMKDKKMLGLDMRSMSTCCDAESLEKFCDEWLMPCLMTKENSKTKQLKLIVHGEMLQELIRKLQTHESLALSQTNIATQQQEQV